MTIEKKGTIELRDIGAVEFICKSCGTITIRKLNDQLKIPSHCGNCDTLWFLNQSDEGQRLRHFLLQIARYGSSEAPYLLRFHVAGLGECSTAPHRGEAKTAVS